MPAEKAFYYKQGTYHAETIMQAWRGNLSCEGLRVILIYDQELNSGLRAAPELWHCADEAARPVELVAEAFPAARHEPGQKWHRHFWGSINKSFEGRWIQFSRLEDSSDYIKAVYWERSFSSFSDKSYYFSPLLLWLCWYLSCSTPSPAERMPGCSKWELGSGRSLRLFSSTSASNALI